MLILKSTEMLSHDEVQQIKNTALRVMRSLTPDVLILPPFLEIVTSPSITCAYCGMSQSLSNGGCSYCGAPLSVLIYGEIA